mgnify:CR=1 FL=1
MSMHDVLFEEYGEIKEPEDNTRMISGTQRLVDSR